MLDNSEMMSESLMCGNAGASVKGFARRVEDSISACHDMRLYARQDLLICCKNVLPRVSPAYMN